MITPTFKVKNVEIDVPIGYGMGVGGFYLVGEDRNTPGGAIVSEWENKLMNGEDEASGSWLEFGVRGFFPAKISGEFYNNKFRASLFVNFGSY